MRPVGRKARRSEENMIANVKMIAGGLETGELDGLAYGLFPGKFKLSTKNKDKLILKIASILTRVNTYDLGVSLFVLKNFASYSRRKKVFVLRSFSSEKISVNISKLSDGIKLAGIELYDSMVKDPAHTEKRMEYRARIIYSGDDFDFQYVYELLSTEAVSVRRLREYRKVIGDLVNLATGNGADLQAIEETCQRIMSIAKNINDAIAISNERDEGDSE
jgi:hypothetical protein